MKDDELYCALYRLEKLGVIKCIVKEKEKENDVSNNKRI